ncbi:MAG: hypothetical protein QNJ47_25940 [Nostocaceae cyanobacterium]|nr:hypothetical protein [Nostocaceae cyanobacterium]
MFKISYTFGLIATALIIAPAAAFAEQTGVIRQEINQTTVVEGKGNTVVQSGSQFNNHNQINLGNRYCKNPQVQATIQKLNQLAVVSGELNTVAQVGNQSSQSNQVNVNQSKYCP